jgi:hypothetical protein
MGRIITKEDATMVGIITNKEEVVAPTMTNKHQK